MNSCFSDIVIIRGAPGTGKSQTSKALSEYFPNGIRIEIDTIRSMVINPIWTNQPEHINILNASIGLVKEFLHLEYKPIIIVDTFSGDKINKYIHKLNSQISDLEIAVFGLFTTEQELKNRIQLRNKEQFNDFPICKKINEDTLKFKYKKEIQIDTTGHNSKMTADKIFESLSKNTCG